MSVNGAAAAILRIRTPSVITEFFRDVYILSRPHGHLFDIDIKARDNKIYCSSDAEFFAELYDGDHLLERGNSLNGELAFTVPEPKLWTAETPELYTVKLSPRVKSITRRVGSEQYAISTITSCL